MKVLVISNLYPPFQLGGYEIGCRSVVEALRGRGHDVRVLTSASHVPVRGEEESVIDRRLHLHGYRPDGLARGATVAQRDAVSGLLSNSGNTATLYDELRTFDPDLVYFFNTLGLGGVGLIDGLETLGWPWAFHLMDRVPVESRRWLGDAELSLFRADSQQLYEGGLLISMSERLIAEINEHAMLPATCRTVVIPGWAPATPTNLDRDYQRDGQTRFAFAGRVSPEKGVDLILHALNKIVSEGVGSVTVHFYGTGEIARAMDLADSLGVRSLVHFHGWADQETLFRAYRESDAFLFPTWEREPFGFAPVEAAAVGCVPILTDLAGASERLVDGVHCIKTDRTPDDLASIMRSICLGEVDIREIGHAAMTLCQDDLSLDSCMDAIEAALTNFVDGKSPKRMPEWSDYLLSYLKSNLSAKLWESQEQHV